MTGRLFATAGRHAKASGAHLTAANMLIFYLALLLLLPARLVLPGMGAAGRPAIVMGLGFLLWWILSRLHPGLKPVGRQPVRTVLLLLALSVAVSYIFGLDRGLSPLEARSADRYIIVFASWLGVALLAADGIRDRCEMRRILSALVLFSSITAFVGILQFYNLDLAPYFRLPGLVYNDVLAGLGVRGGPAFNRVYGTQGHYIEFGVVLAIVLPLALHHALARGKPQAAVGAWTSVALIAAAIPLSISRAAALGLVTGFVFLSLVWPRPLRVKLLALAGIGVLAFQAVTPGVLGTIKSAFLNFSNDPSITARLDDYAATGALIRDRPWFGRGPGTYIPEIYRILDNQFLGSLLEVGYVGTCCLLAIFIGGIAMARSVRKRAVAEVDAHLGQALAAGMTVALVASFTFDSLYFPAFAGLTFTVFGLTGAHWRIYSSEVEMDDESVRLSQPAWAFWPAASLVQDRDFGSR